MKIICQYLGSSLKNVNILADYLDRLTSLSVCNLQLWIALEVLQSVLILIFLIILGRKL